MLSIIIATFNAPDLLKLAIDSVLRQTSPNWEIVVSPDDGQDYSRLRDLDKRIQVVESNAIATGPGAARNRALEYVRGTAVASLDDDDELSMTYVEDALTALASTPVVVFPTRYSDIRVIAQHLDSINIEQFSQLLGSLHVVARRECFPPWPNCFAEDVIHTCKVIEQQGGSIPVINTAEYILNVRDASMCATYKNIDAEYADIICNTTSTAMANLFRYRQHINRLYQGSSLNYHAFVEQLTTNEINSIIHF